MKGLSIQLVVLLLAAVALGQEFFPIDSYELSPDSEDYFGTSRHDEDDYPSEYERDSREDDSSYDENDALFDSPSRARGKTDKRERYFNDEQSRKARGPTRKIRHHPHDLMPGASRHRSDRTRRARLSDYDLYYPKRQKIPYEDSKEEDSTPSFDFDDLMHTTSTPLFESSSVFDRQKESLGEYDGGPRRTKTVSYDKLHQSVQAPTAVYKDDPFGNPSYSQQRRLAHQGESPRRSTSGFKAGSKTTHWIEPRKRSSTISADSFNKPSRSVMPRGSSSDFAYHGESLKNVPHDEPRQTTSRFKDDFFSKSFHSVDPQRPSSGFIDDFFDKPSNSAGDAYSPFSGLAHQGESISSYSEPNRPSSGYKSDFYSKPSHSVDPLSGFFESDSFGGPSPLDVPRKPSMDPSESFQDGPSSHLTESYPTTESYYKKPSRKRIRSKKIEVEPTLRSIPPSDGQFFAVPSPRRRRVKLPDVITDVKRPFKTDRGVLTEEKAATGYGGPMREQFHEQGTTGPRSYKFGYSTGDPDNPMARYEQRDPDGLVRGSYSYRDPMGTLRVVRYEAHPERGFTTSL